jgi:hypothetical protein
MDILASKARVVEAKLHGAMRHATLVFDARQALFGDRGNKLSIANERRRRIVGVSANSEYVHRDFLYKTGS